MDSSLLLFLTILSLAGLPGADGVSTVTHVAVQSGGSVTIPCHYDRKYDNNVKYWCRGYLWTHCDFVVRTDSPKTAGKVSITDDPSHHVFTVSMKSLQTGDSGYYWCAVEIKNKWTLDDRARMYLSVTAGTPELRIDKQEVIGEVGGTVSVQCYYSNPGSVMQWCRYGDSCVKQNSRKPERSEIRDDRSRKVFTVTVRRLERTDAGWYWCAAGKLQIPVCITITQKTTTKIHTIPKSSTSQQTATVTLTSPQTSTGGNRTTTEDNGQNSEPSCLEPILGALRKTGVALVFLICTIVAIWKIWRSRRPRSAASERESRRRYVGPCIAKPTPVESP